jgi:hypothetical protein
MPDGSAHNHSAGRNPGHEEHGAATRCFACVLATAPGVLADTCRPERVATPTATATGDAPQCVRLTNLAWSPQLARAPPVNPST